MRVSITFENLPLTIDFPTADFPMEGEISREKQIKILELQNLKKKRCSFQIANGVLIGSFVTSFFLGAVNIDPNLFTPISKIALVATSLLLFGVFFCLWKGPYTSLKKKIHQVREEVQEIDRRAERQASEMLQNALRNSIEHPLRTEEDQQVYNLLVQKLVDELKEQKKQIVLQKGELAHTLTVEEQFQSQVGVAIYGLNQRLDALENLTQEIDISLERLQKELEKQPPSAVQRASFSLSPIAL